MNIRRFRQLLQYGWKHATEISQETATPKVLIFKDILLNYYKYSLWSNQYKDLKFWKLSKNEKENLGLSIKEQNTIKENWLKELFENNKLKDKWGDFKYEKNGTYRVKRCNAYRKHFEIGSKSFIGYGVTIQKFHPTSSIIRIGCNCYLGDLLDIDYTGGLSIADNVAVSEGVKIFTHNHDLYVQNEGNFKRTLILTPLFIENNVWIGARSIILPNVKRIGRYANIGAGAVVRHQVPPYAILVGNPAKIIGFLFSPEEVQEYEKDRYPDSEKTDIKKYTKLYEKYFLNRTEEIKNFLSN